MKLMNLLFVRTVNLPKVRVIDKVVSYQTYSLGGGEWSIEAKTTSDQSVWGPSCMEWVGNNGTRTFINDEGYLENEPADDLWAEVSEWEKDPQGGMKVIKPARSYKEYKAPDGTTGSMNFFMKEARRGKLHGCVACF